jgi:hypothetical protein
VRHEIARYAVVWAVEKDLHYYCRTEKGKSVNSVAFRHKKQPEASDSRNSVEKARRALPFTSGFLCLAESFSPTAKAIFSTGGRLFAAFDAVGATHVPTGFHQFKKKKCLYLKAFPRAWLYARYVILP